MANIESPTITFVSAFGGPTSAQGSTPIRTHPEAGLRVSFCSFSDFLFPSPHEAALLPSAAVAKKCCFLHSKEFFLLKCLILMVTFSSVDGSSVRRASVRRLVVSATLSFLALFFLYIKRHGKLQQKGTSYPCRTPETPGKRKGKCSKHKEIHARRKRNSNKNKERKGRVVHSPLGKAKTRADDS